MATFRSSAALRHPRFPRARFVRRVATTVGAIVLLAATVVAQFESFNPAFDGQLWAVRNELVPPAHGFSAGVAFVNGTMFVADIANHTVIAYDVTGNLVAMPGADWDTSNPLSPVFGLVPDQLAAITVTVDGADRQTLFVSDAESNRVAVFDAANGSYLFTLRLQRPTAEPTVSLGIGQLAMSPGAKFHLNTIASTLTLNGSFAAAWREQQMSGVVYSGAFAFLGASSVFTSTGSEFVGSATSVLTGTEADPPAPAPQYVFGVTFDTTGNLYVLDAFNERLHVYSPELAPLFTFGTPVAGGGTAEFHEPWGLAFWPDAVGTSGRIFINDTYNNRILVYRPTDGADANDTIDGLQFETVVENFVAPVPAIELYSIAIDPVTATLAVTDFAQSRVVVLQKPRLATFNVELLDADDTVISSVCSGAGYRVRFSLTVPAGLAPVTDVTPALSIDGVPSGVAPVPAAVYPSSTLSAGQVMTFTYAMPGSAADVHIIAGATASNTTDILSTSVIAFISNCAGETDATSFDAQENIPAQVSGWTPVLEGQTFAIALHVQDDDGIEVIQYELDGANRSPGVVTTSLAGAPTAAQVDVTFPEFGRTSMRYRARDGNGIWSPWQSTDVRTKPVIGRSTNENDAVNFRVGDPEGTGISYSVSGLPAGVSFAANTGQFAGVVSFDANQPYSADPILSTGVYNVVITETAENGATSNVSFIWTINHINRHPIIANPPVEGFSIKQGEPFDMKINGSDPDGDPAIFTMRGRSPSGRDLPPTITIDAATGQISGIFPTDADTDYEIVVGLAECGEQTPDPPCDRPLLPGVHLATLFGFQVTVLDANLPPDIVNPGPQSSAEGAVVNLAVQSSDIEGDTLAFAASGLPAGLSIDPASGVISGTVSFDAAGAYAVTVTVADLVNTPNPSVTFAWTVTDTNRPPVAAFPDRINIEGAIVAAESISHFASDPDESPISFVSATGLPPGVMMSPAGLLAGALDFNTAGIYTVTVAVSDGIATVDDSFTWTIHNVNRPPILNPSNQSNAEGDVVAYQVPATDPDGDAMVFSVTGLPAGLSLDASTGLITGTLGYNTAGTYHVNIGASDVVATDSLAVLKTFTWTIGDRNPPDVVNPGSQTSNEGASVSLQIIATDLDGDVLTYTAANLPPGLSIDAAGRITGTLGFNAAGTYVVTVRATDSSLLSDAETFTWLVNNVNRAPIAIADTATVMQTQSVSIDVRSNDTDLDGDTLTIVGVTAPTSGIAAIDALNGTISFTAISPTFLGTSTFTYTISDGTTTSTATVTVTIIPNNLAPVCSAATGGAIGAPNHKRFHVAPIGGVYDPDGNPIAIRVTGIWQDEPIDSTGDGQFAPDGRIENGQAWIRAERNGPGNKAAGNGRVYEILFTATDDRGASCIGSVFWTVPHDQRNSIAIDDGVRYDSTGAIAGVRDKSQIHQKSAKP